MSEIDSHKFACAVAQFLDDKLAKDITILNISNVSSLADYFVIATGDSTPQVKALMETVKDKVKTVFSRLPIRQENDVKNRWNLLDYGDVVVHILHKEERETVCWKMNGEKLLKNIVNIKNNYFKSWFNPAFIFLNI